MTSYYLSPDLYELVYADMVADIAPHVAAAKAAGGPVLEVCCGTGRLMIPTLEAGVDCDGLDVEPAMLDALRAKLAARGLSAGVYEADMRSFKLERRYALIAIGFNSFLHNLTQDDQIATLRRCREHLAPGGCLQLMVFHPSAEKLIQWSGAESFVKELPLPDGGRLRVHDKAHDDRVEQIRRMTRRLEFLDAAGHKTNEESLTFDLRYVFKPEMELLLRVAGFRQWKVEPLFAAYSDASVYPAGQGPREGDHLRWSAWGANA
jgi:SAM-dependent methyltransferase